MVMSYLKNNHIQILHGKLHVVKVGTYVNLGGKCI